MLFSSGNKTYITTYNQTGVALSNITTQVVSGHKSNATNLVPQSTANFLLNNQRTVLLQSFNKLPTEGTAISPFKGTSITIDPMDPNLEEHSHTQVTISGTLRNITTDSPLGHKEISIKVNRNNTIGKLNEIHSWSHQYTDNDGVFTVPIQDFNYDKGTYVITARPNDNRIYSAEDEGATRRFVVLGHPLSLADLSSSIATGGVIVGIFIGILSGIPPIIRRKNRRNLCSYMKEIDLKVESSRTKDECIQYLEDMKSEIIEILKKGKISEEQYKMLDEKISAYISQVEKVSEREKNNQHLGSL